MAKDVIAEGLASGRWKVQDASQLNTDLELTADVVIVGTGAGGGVSAEILAKAGLKVVLLEEGALHFASRDFRLTEANAYPNLYQESAGRQTKDKGITILQGRAVGGSTVVNWTSSFRTPPSTLKYWQSQFGLKALTVESMQPWFEKAEKRLNVIDWNVEPNVNNTVLKLGADRLGISWSHIRRNVNGCMNLGYCGMGCPVNAKQSMLVSTIPSALDKGAVLVTRARAERIVMQGGKAQAIEASAMDGRGIYPSGRKIRVLAKAFVLAGGSINTPGLLLRSDEGLNPYQRVGKRTFLHPVNISGAFMPFKVEGWNGAPQSIYSDHFLESQPIDGPIGYKLEVPPLHPVLTAITMTGFGAKHRSVMSRFAQLQVVLSLLRDGFHPDSPGGNVELKRDGTPVLDYPITDFVWEGLRRSYLTMAELQFAAGATRVVPIHEDIGVEGYSSWAEAKRGISELPLEILRAKIVSAHVMGGCGMSADPRQGVVDVNGRHHQVDNLYVFDGSAFPTSIGANPQLSIYGLVARNASRLAEQLIGRPVDWLAA